MSFGNFGNFGSAPSQPPPSGAGLGGMGNNFSNFSNMQQSYPTSIPTDLNLAVEIPKQKLRVNLTNNERGFYSATLFQADPMESSKVQSKVAVTLFKRSGLPVDVLKKIWLLASENNDFLNREEFYVALKLISYAQNNIEVSADSIIKGLPSPLPKFAPVTGAPAPAGQKEAKENDASPAGMTEANKSFDSAPVMGAPPAKPQDDPVLTIPEDKIKSYEAIIDKMPTQAKGIITSAEAKTILGSTQVPGEFLFRVWQLCDTGDKGHLDRGEVIVTLHMIWAFKTGQNVPEVLPPSLKAFIQSYKARHQPQAQTPPQQQFPQMTQQAPQAQKSGFDMPTEAPKPAESVPVAKTTSAPTQQNNAFWDAPATKHEEPKKPSMSKFDALNDPDLLPQPKSQPPAQQPAQQVQQPKPAAPAPVAQPQPQQHMVASQQQIKSTTSLDESLPARQETSKTTEVTPSHQKAAPAPSGGMATGIAGASMFELRAKIVEQQSQMNNEMNKFRSETNMILAEQEEEKAFLGTLFETFQKMQKKMQEENEFFANELKKLQEEKKNMRTKIFAESNKIVGEITKTANLNREFQSVVGYVSKNLTETQELLHKVTGMVNTMNPKLEGDLKNAINVMNKTREEVNPAKIKAQLGLQEGDTGSHQAKQEENSRRASISVDDSHGHAAEKQKEKLHDTSMNKSDAGEQKEKSPRRSDDSLPQDNQAADAVNESQHSEPAAKSEHEDVKSPGEAEKKPEVDSPEPKNESPKAPSPHEVHPEEQEKPVVEEVEVKPEPVQESEPVHEQAPEPVKVAEDFGKGFGGFDAEPQHQVQQEEKVVTPKAHKEEKEEEEHKPAPVEASPPVAEEKAEVKEIPASEKPHDNTTTASHWESNESPPKDEKTDLSVPKEEQSAKKSPFEGFSMDFNNAENKEFQAEWVDFDKNFTGGDGWGGTQSDSKESGKEFGDFTNFKF